MADKISNSDDIIDSRDVIARIEELESARYACLEPLEVAQFAAGEREWAESEAGAELAALKALQDDAEGYAPDWKHGATLIRDSYFQDYAEQLADDIGAINAKAHWPNNCIDWEKAASELQMDYTSVEFDGVTYWVR